MLTIYPLVMNKAFSEVTKQNSGKSNVECLPYFNSLFQEPNNLKNNKVASINIYNIPCNFFNIKFIL